MHKINEILSKTDHTLLSPCATELDIKHTVEEGIKYSVASVCIPPCYVKRAKNFAQGQVKICTVIGFPLGYSETTAKVLEAECAVRDGADEVDMVVNISDVKNGLFDKVFLEINAVKAAIGDKILKVIIEACYLTRDEKIKMCRVVSASDADFIKTSTGFGTGGAVLEDITLFHERMTNGKGIKAAGGNFLL